MIALAPHPNDLTSLAFGVAFALLLVLLAGGLRWRAKYGPGPKISEAVLPPPSSQHPFIQTKEHKPCDSPN